MKRSSSLYRGEPSRRRRGIRCCAAVSLLLLVSATAARGRAATLSQTVPLALLDQAALHPDIPLFNPLWGELQRVTVELDGAVSVSGTAPGLAQPYGYEVWVDYAVVDAPGRFRTFPFGFGFDFEGATDGQGEGYQFSGNFFLQAVFDAATDAQGGHTEPFVIASPGFRRPAQENVRATLAGMSSESEASYVTTVLQDVAVLPPLELADDFPAAEVTTTALMTIAYEYQPDFGTDVALGVIGDHFFGRPLPFNGEFESEMMDQSGPDVRHARARVGSGLGASSNDPPRFELGLAVSDADEFSFLTSAAARAVTRYRVEGAPAGGFIPASFTIEGAIEPLDTAGARLIVFLQGYREQSEAFMGILDLVSSTQDGVEYLVDECPEPGVTCSARQNFSGWSGSHTLSFGLPVDPEGYVDAWAWALAAREADADVSMDFLGTGRLEVHPPPGVTVTLSTGQVFSDADGDGVVDGSDNCPGWPNAGQADVDDNGIGDACECGDQTGDGVVTVADILAINDVIFEVLAAAPLCDTNDDGLCDVRDILGANAKIFGAEAHCERYPTPAP